ncbi:DUF192 domain-containing protein, partial [Arthrospira platensis SPKY1]|nr:DUF192 domain-containing protein [Arthrospira platensis SPKY1]
TLFRSRCPRLRGLEGGSEAWRGAEAGPSAGSETGAAAGRGAGFGSSACAGRRYDAAHDVSNGVPRMMIRRLLAHACLSIAAFAPGAAALAQIVMPVAELGAGMYRIEAEVAHTFETRQIGLMNREAMALHRGMVFVFPDDARHCMWMRNT